MDRFLSNAENKLREYRTRNPLLIYRNDGYAGRVAKTVALKVVVNTAYSQFRNGRNGGSGKLVVRVA
jgi:hypothetical protein